MIIHIAGSKGKGSTAHLLAHLLQEAEQKVGLFTSPFILDEREMVRVNGSMVPEARWTELKAAQDPSLSEFETATLAAMDYFAEMQCDAVILECGWGGARDATNWIGHKDLTLLTHVELEHTAVLGSTIEAITEEKLGICRPGVPLLTPRSQDPSVFEVMQRMRITPILVEGQAAGHHHPESVGLALAAAEHLGFPAEAAALENVTIPGRLEVMEWQGHQLILDGAHTPDSVAFVKAEVEAMATHPVHWALHFLSDKNPELPHAFDPANSSWIDLEDERAGAAPAHMKNQNLELFLEEWKDREPHTLAIVGSFRLIAAVKKRIML